MPISRHLHAASLPFVTRAMRGGHRIRYAVIAVLLALVSVVLGAWVALGSGSFEHRLRVGLNLEPTMATQEGQGFKLFAEDEFEAVELRRLIRENRSAIGLARIARNEYVFDSEVQSRVVERLRDGLIELTSVQHGGSRGLYAYREPTNALLARFQLDDIGMLRDWSRSDELKTRERLDNILARELRPAVEIYRSPLAVVDVLTLTGMIAGGMTLLLLMIYGPVLAGTQMAQEVHENTLQPLTGTALSARELVLGLSLGPAAVVALLAAPQVVLLLAAALAVGHVLPALAMLLVALVGGAFLTVLAQLAGFALGSQRTPGILGVALLGVLAPLSLFGAVLGFDLPRDGIGALALVPQAAASHSLFEAFLPAGTAMRASGLSPGHVAAAEVSVAIGTLGMLCFAFLGLRALERRVGELAPAALRRWEALLGACVSIGLILIANPWTVDHHNPTQFYLGNFALMLVPLTILLMMRVPLGDTPPALRRVPFGKLLAEFAAGVALYFTAAIACMGVERLGLATSPVALVYLAWMIAVTGLLAIRVVALPMSLLAKVWAGVCMIGVGVAFVHVVEWSRGSYALSHVFALWDLSPLLGVLQVVLMALIPALLVRALQNRGRNSASMATNPE